LTPVKDDSGLVSRYMIVANTGVSLHLLSNMFG